MFKSLQGSMISKRPRGGIGGGSFSSRIGIFNRNRERMTPPRFTPLIPKRFSNAQAVLGAKADKKAVNAKFLEVTKEMDELEETQEGFETRIAEMEDKDRYHAELDARAQKSAQKQGMRMSEAFAAAGIDGTAASRFLDQSKTGFTSNQLGAALTGALADVAVKVGVILDELDQVFAIAGTNKKYSQDHHEEFLAHVVDNAAAEKVMMDAIERGGIDQGSLLDNLKANRYFVGNSSINVLQTALSWVLTKSTRLGRRKGDSLTLFGSGEERAVCTESGNITIGDIIEDPYSHITVVEDGEIKIYEANDLAVNDNGLCKVNGIYHVYETLEVGPDMTAFFNIIAVIAASHYGGILLGGGTVFAADGLLSWLNGAKGVDLVQLLGKK